MRHGKIRAAAHVHGQRVATADRSQRRWLQAVEAVGLARQSVNE
jgi:hypothetical protein